MDTSLPAQGNILTGVSYNADNFIRTLLAQIPPINIARVCLGKGKIIQPHMDSHAAFFLVITGKGIITRGSEKISAKANDFLFINENQQRGIEAVEDLTLLVVRQ